MSDKIKFGILGFGLFGERRLIPGFKQSKLAELIAITKSSKEAAKKKADEYNIKYAYSYDNKAAFLENDEIEAVFIATPNYIHMKDTIDCLKAGKHVLLEKPMAMNADECKQIIKVENETGKKVMIAHCLRFNTTVEFVKKKIENGILGNIVSCTADFLSEGFKSQRSWKFNKTVAGGGAAFDLGVHMVDTLRFLIDSEIEKVFCVKKPRIMKPDEVDLQATFLLDFKNGVTGRATSSFLGKRNLFLEVFGENGYIRAYDWNSNYVKIRVESEIDGEFKSELIENEDMYAKEIDSFCRSILNDKPTAVTTQDGWINQKIIDMVNE